MPKGGARIRVGSPPQLGALKRERDGKDWVKLPAGGREGPPPPWPLQGDPAEVALLTYLEEEAARLRDDWTSCESPSRAQGIGRRLDKITRELAERRGWADVRDKQELAFWEELWRKPQALVWEADGTEHNVALYVRTYLEAARPNVSAGMRTLARQLADSLLLTSPALHSARYVIDGEGDPAAVVPSRKSRATAASIKSRFTVVSDADEDTAEA